MRAVRKQINHLFVISHSKHHLCQIEMLSVLHVALEQRCRRMHVVKNRHAIVGFRVRRDKPSSWLVMREHHIISTRPLHGALVELAKNPENSSLTKRQGRPFYRAKRPS